MTRVLVAIIGAPHGVTGEVRLKTFTEDPLAILSYGDVETADGRVLRTVSGRVLKGDLVVARIEGVRTREAAEALKGCKLFVARARLPEPEDEETFYHADLIGLEAVTEDGRSLGRIIAISNYGAGDLLEIAPEGRRSGALVPFTRAFVPVIDLAAGRAVIRPPAGLFEA